MNPKHIRVKFQSDIGEYLEETYYKNAPCELCYVEGAYKIDTDPNSGGLCLKHIIDQYGRYEVIER